jgi:signal transduction histidine kinase
MKLTHKLMIGLGLAVLFNFIIFLVAIHHLRSVTTKFSILDAIDIGTTIEKSIALELGDLSINENPAQLQKYVPALSEITGRDIVVVNKDKIIVADIGSELDEIGKKFDYDKGEIEQTMQDGKPRIFREVSEDVPDGVELVVVPLYDNPLDKENAKIVGAVITSYAEPNLTSMKFAFLGTFGLLVIVSITIGLWLIHSIYKPFSIFKNAVAQIGRGKLDTQINIATNDELESLAQAFNKMVTDLKTTTTSIEHLDKEIADRKYAEAMLKKLNNDLAQMNNDLSVSNEKFAQANDELKNFVYIASHDLREPLRKISVFGSMLQTSLAGKLNDEDGQNLYFMIDGAKRMTKMIEGLLTYSRVNTQSRPFQNVDLNDVIDNIRQFELSVVIGEKKVEFEIPKSLPAVEGDPVQLTELMQNLIANGIKYQPKENASPKITITYKPAADNMTRIEITDNGIGIKPEYHSQIFAMFKRLHSRTEYEGTGIGLSVCKKIIERHNGQIGVESQFGQGSTFWFTLPSAKVPATLQTTL